MNTDQHLLAVGSLLRELPTLNGARVALLGLSYKPNTDDLRDSPAVTLARQLITRAQPSSLSTQWSTQCRNCPN